MYKRVQYELVERRITEPRGFIQVIHGPRQVGKTTLVLQILEAGFINGRYESADGLTGSQTAWLSTIWETARAEMRYKKYADYVLIIDEIQKIDGWSEIVKANWDSDSRFGINLKVVLLGSSRLLMQRGLTESLAGRFELIYLPHWSFVEMNEAFGWSVEKYVFFGGFPGSVPLVDDEQRWKSYIADSMIDTSLNKDILMLTRVDKPALLRRLFELGVAYSGQILAYTKIMGQLLEAGNSTTLANYLALLDTAGMLAGIERFSGNTIRQRSSSPKFQVYNTAYLSALSRFSFQATLSKHELWGRFVESSVGAHLLNCSIGGAFDVSYWREGNHEVDFVVKKHDAVMALEVKGGLPRALDGLATFRRKVSSAKTFLIGEKGIPLHEFLSSNPVDLL